MPATRVMGGLGLDEVVARGWGELGGGPIEQPEWAAACLAAGAEPDALRVVSVVRGSRLAAVAPMTVDRVRGVRRSVMLGVGDHKEPMDLLAADAEALDALADALAREPRPLEFGRLPAGSPAVDALRRAFRGRALVVGRSRAPFPYIPLDPSWAVPESHLSTRRRSDLRRARRRADAAGEVTMEFLSPGPDEVDALLDEALAVEARSWKTDAGTSMASDAREEALVRNFARGTAEQGALRLSFLRIDGRAVAMQIATVHSGAYWLLKIGYDEAFARCSPGVLLLRESISRAATEGLASFEFLGRSESWITVWTPFERPTVCLRVYPLRASSVVALGADLGEWAGRLAPPAKRRARRVAAHAAESALRTVAGRYVAGPTLGNAMEAAARFAEEGATATIGFWDGPEVTPREVAGEYTSALAGLAGRDDDPVLAVKLPALQMSAELVDQVAGHAVAAGRRLHVDALAPEVADEIFRLVDGARAAHPALRIGVTLPGRWERSPADAARVRRLGLPVRVVKGEWADPDAPDRDPHDGFLEVIDALAGGEGHVGVATHDPALAAEAIRRLRAAGTPCGLELLMGLPMRASLQGARLLEVPVRVYVPYGHAYMPYALGQIRRRPRIAGWIARDMAGTALEAVRRRLR